MECGENSTLEKLLADHCLQPRDCLDLLREDLQGEQVQRTVLVDGVDIYEQDREDILQLLLDEHGLSLETVNSDTMTALCFAAAHGAEKCTELLIARGARVNHQANEGETPLWWAVYNTLEEHDCMKLAQRGCVEQLIRAGANVNLADYNGQSPLSLASAMGKSGAVRSLIQAGANVHHQSAGGYTPLMEGIVSGNTLVIQLLIEAGSDLFACDGQGRSLEEQLAARAASGVDVSGPSNLVRAAVHRRELEAIVSAPCKKARM